jgi:peptidoglycan/LPS O-acetylase OafA/YrhL
MALAVVATHTGGFFPDGGLYPLRFIPGMKAVQTFYIISGFYMALILKDKYLNKPHSFKIFITNRILRIYPLYYIILGLSILYYLCTIGKPADNPWLAWEQLFREKNWLLLASLTVSTICIIGQDALLFTMGLSSAGLTLFIPQAWTLSIEMMFYLIVPFIIRLRTSFLIGLFSLSLLLRMFLATQGLKYDPWTHRFFPSELMLFIAGILSFKIYQKIRHKSIPLTISATIFTAILGMIFLFPVFGPSLSYGKTIVYFLGLSLGLPFIFHLTKDSRFDRWIGDFSYPIYISHILVRTVLIGAGTYQSSLWFGWKVAGGSFLLSFLLLHFIIYPIDKIREKRVLDHKL